MSRSLASIRKITNIEPIPEADRIEVATVDSWKVIIEKAEFKINDLVVYFEIDSWIPSTLKSNPKQKLKVYNEVEGFRLRTIVLRGQISQGLIMGIETLSEKFPDIIHVKEGDDVSQLLGIMKWELPPNLENALAKGLFPSFIPKTDQERIQNLTKKFEDYRIGKWEIIEKLDGASMTIYHHTRYGTGVCSRNLDLKREGENGIVNAYWRAVEFQGLIELFERNPELREENLALQGELVGVAKNSYGMKHSHKFYLFDIYEIDSGKYFTPQERVDFATKYKIAHTPILHEDFVIDTQTIEELIIFADGKSVICPKQNREGLVFKNGRQSFKIISNEYLCKFD